MYQRPKLGESEEDLLKLQEEFFKNKAENKITPAARLVEAKQGETSVAEEKRVEEIQVRLENTFEDIPSDINVGDVVEKATSSRPVSKFKFSRSSGFPQAKPRDPSISNGRGSLFSQQMKKSKPNDDCENMDVTIAPINSSNLKITERKQFNDPLSINLPPESFIITGSEKQTIHQQNVDFMSKMTEQEIFEEREKLMSTMDPAIIAFLKSKRYHNKAPVENRQPSMAEQNQAVDDLNIGDLEAPNEILMNTDAEKWLNFDVLETNKLAWMKGVKIPKLEKDKQYEARFDFNGWLLPYTDDEINEKNRILYHHGEEPGRPGYTLQELFQLCRSSVIQQKIVALNTIANILNLQSTGIYDEIIDIPLEQIFFVLRFCLDENSPATLNSSIKAIRNLFYYPIDETCLDSLLGFGLGEVQPTLAVDNAESDDDKTINDQQLAETNLMKCLARTDILIRIRYILNTVKPQIETVVYCLEILIRLIRDSNFIMMQVYQCEGLIENIVMNFVPKIYKPSSISSAYGIPIIHAIKFLRILSARSKTIATELITEYKILDSIATYISNEFVSTNSSGLKLQIESLHLWSTLAHYGLGIDYFKVLQPVLLRFLDHHLRTTDVSVSTSYAIQAHISSFLKLLSKVAKHDYSVILIYIKLIVDLGIAKWCTQFACMETFLCGKLQLISSLLNLLANMIEYQPSNVHLPLEKCSQYIQGMIGSSSFEIVTKNIENGSNILNNYGVHKCSTNFRYTEAAVWNAVDHVIPVIQTSSCLPFLCTLSKFVEKSNSIQLKLSFLNHPNIQKYISLIQNAKLLHLTNSWYTKIESDTIINILKTAVTVQKNIEAGMYYETTMKCLSAFHAEQKSDVEFLLRNIVFSPQFYPSEVLMRNLNLTDESDALKLCLDNIDDIFEVYIKVLGLRNNVLNFTTNLCIDVNCGNIMPVDWIYSPIIVLYSNQEENKTATSEVEQTYIVTNCLRWVYIYETYFPSLATMINATDRFCRLACTFLGSDSLFLVPEVRNLLELCVKQMLASSETQINFDRPIHGLHNFQDFYTQLLEQYQGVSYGDKLFGNFILIPLVQRHNVKFRKTLWSEYAGIVQIFSVPTDEAFCPLTLFLEPAENDISLLKCYRKLLMAGAIRKHSILYTIANHHVKTFVAKNCANKKTTC